MNQSDYEAGLRAMDELQALWTDAGVLRNEIRQLQRLRELAGEKFAIDSELIDLESGIGYFLQVVAPMKWLAAVEYAPTLYVLAQEKCKGVMERINGSLKENPTNEGLEAILQ